jgi:diaminopimelate decarboxylase
MPELICLRYNPGPKRTGNSIIGNPVESKYGVSHGQLVDAYKAARDFGAKRFGLHTMLVSKAINHKDIYRKYVGVDASAAALMRPGIYGAYHHITVVGKIKQPCAGRVDVVGPLCENNGKFAVQRALPEIQEGDILCIHDTGAHGHAMGFNYNGRLRPKELLLRSDGTVELIRREETVDDYFATLNFTSQTLIPESLKWLAN